MGNTDRKANVESGDKVELADKETGFYDPVTKLKVVRDQQVEVGKTIGNKTNQAIISGALLIVETKIKKSSKPEKE